MNILNFAILKCLQIKNIPTSIIKNNGDPKKVIPNSKPMFSLEERKIINNSKVQPKKINNCLTTSKNEILLAAIANKNKHTLDKINDLIQQIKNEDIIEKSFSILQTVHKVFCASKNCVILAFKDTVDAETLNKYAQSKDFLLSCCQYLRQPFYFAGFKIKELNSLKENIKKQMHQKIDDLNLDKLREIFNKNKPIQQIAYDCVYKHLNKEGSENE